MINAVLPELELRCGHESALIGDELHLFGGRNRDCYFPRNEILTCNVRNKEKKKWIRHLSKGGITPPPCEGAQCVVIDEILYSYGGWKEDGNCLGEVYSYNPKNAQWIHVVSSTRGKKPWERSYCCLWAIGRRLIMFGGESADIPQGRLQSKAKSYNGVNNEIYEFVFDATENGFWLDLEISGSGPKPRSCAAVETIDQHRGLLHGGHDGCGLYFDDTFVIDLQKRTWTYVNFSVKPSARYNHRICRMKKAGFKGRNCFLLFGGINLKNFSDHTYVLDFDNEKFYKLYLNPRIEPVYVHTLHCVETQDGTAQVFVVGGQNWDNKLNQILIEYHLDSSNVDFTCIEYQIMLQGGDKLQYILEQAKEKEEIRRDLTKVTNEFSIQTELHAKEKQVLIKEKQILLAKYQQVLGQLKEKRIECKNMRTNRDSCCDCRRSTTHLLKNDLFSLLEQKGAAPAIARDQQSPQYLYQKDLSALRKIRKSRSHQVVYCEEEAKNTVAEGAKKLGEDTDNIDREVLEEEISQLATLLPEHWKKLSRQLPGEKESVGSLTQKYTSDPGELPHAMLTDWYNRNGSDATVGRLCAALLEVGQRRAAEKVFGVRAVFFK